MFIYLTILKMSLVWREDSVESKKDISEEIVVEQKPKKWFFFYLKTFVFTAVILVILWSFISYMYESATTIKVDNPTLSWVVIQFNDLEEISISANSFSKVDLKPWKYNLKVDWENLWDFEKWYFDWDSFLNPTNSIYLWEYVLYGDESWLSKLPNNKVEAYWNEAEGPFKKYEWIYIKDDWDYWIDKNLPEEVELNSWQSYKIKLKIYRFNNFVDMYNKIYIWE
jgi:hypothetical protein